MANPEHLEILKQGVEGLRRELWSEVVYETEITSQIEVNESITQS